MGLAERKKLYEEMEGIRKRPLLVYVTSKRNGASAEMASDVLPFLIDQLDKIPSNTKEIDFLISSLGGDPMVAWRIMSLIRERLDGIDVSVLIPHSAYSAATLLALGANRIIMHPNGHLGPVDMQITVATESVKHFSTEDIGAFIEFVRDHLGITDQEYLCKLFERTCHEVGTTGVGFTARSQKLAVTLGEKLLKMHPSENQSESHPKSVIEKLTSQFHSHAYPLSRKEAIDIDLPIEEKRDPDVERVMWSIWLDLENELKERESFNPITYAVNHKPTADRLLSEVPMMPLPANAPGPSYMQGDVATVLAATKGVPPVDFELKTALLESSRLSFNCLYKGTILTSRFPDLTIQSNVIATFRGWTKSL